MSSEPRVRRLVERTAAAVERAAADEQAARDGRPLAPGDLLVHPATASWPLEWLLVQLDGGRARVVPADAFAAAMPGDLVVPPEDAGGPLVLRARHSAWIGADHLDLRNRSGRLPRGAVERARFLAERSTAGSTPSAALDEEPPPGEDAASWQAELAAARAALLAAAPAAARPARRKLLVPPRLLGLAASVLLVVSALLTGRLLTMEASMERLERERRGDAAAVAALEAARQRETALARESKAALDALRAEHARDREDRQRLPPAAINVPFLWLAADETVRGEAPALTLPAGGDLVVLIVPLLEPSRFDRYRVELVRGGEVAWHSDGLVPTGIAELSLALPRSLLPSGEYRLRVSGLTTAGAKRLSTFRFRVAAAPASGGGVQRQSP